MQDERRLVGRVLRRWSERAQGRFPRLDEIEGWIFGEDWANCLVIAVHSPVELSHFVQVGVNLAVALCPRDTLAGVLLSHLPQVLAEPGCRILDGRATIRGKDVLYRGALLPLSERGRAIDHVLGAVNYGALRAGSRAARFGPSAPD